MTKSAPEIFDAGMARLQSSVSMTPGLGRWVMHSASPNYVRSRWHVLPVPADTIPEWVGFDDDPSSGAIPRWYRSAGVIGINAAMLDEKQEELRASGLTVLHAAAYRVGNKALVSVMQDRTRFECPDAIDDTYLVALRRGRQAMDATAGLLVTQDMSYHVLEGSLSDEGTLPIADVRQPIPII